MRSNVSALAQAWSFDAAAFEMAAASGRSDSQYSAQAFVLASKAGTLRSV